MVSLKGALFLILCGVVLGLSVVEYLFEISTYRPSNSISFFFSSCDTDQQGEVISTRVTTQQSALPKCPAKPPNLGKNLKTRSRISGVGTGGAEGAVAYPSNWMGGQTPYLPPHQFTQKC